VHEFADLTTSGSELKRLAPQGPMMGESYKKGCSLPPAHEILNAATAAAFCKIVVQAAFREMIVIL
jgi:hypothetical protein